MFPLVGSAEMRTSIADVSMGGTVVVVGNNYSFSDIANVQYLFVPVRKVGPIAERQYEMGRE
jgi:hypothetical protein